MTLAGVHFSSNFEATEVNTISASQCGTNVGPRGTQEERAALLTIDTAT